MNWKLFTFGQRVVPSKWDKSIKMFTELLLIYENTRVGSHSLLQGLFLTQELNLGLLHYRQVLYHLSHQANPRRSF